MGKESILSGKDLIVFEKRRSVLHRTPKRFGGNAETVFGWVFLTILVNAKLSHLTLSMRAEHPPNPLHKGDSLFQ